MADAPYEIQYSQEAAEDVQALRAYDQRKILAAVERHLSHNPTQVSRARIKQMHQPFWSQYRLRVEDFRVYYDVDDGQRRLSILRVLKKEQGETPGRLLDETD